MNRSQNISRYYLHRPMYHPSKYEHSCLYYYLTDLTSSHKTVFTLWSWNKFVFDCFSCQCDFWAWSPIVVVLDSTKVGSPLALSFLETYPKVTQLGLQIIHIQSNKTLVNLSSCDWYFCNPWLNLWTVLAYVVYHEFWASFLGIG